MSPNVSIISCTIRNRNEQCRGTPLFIDTVALYARTDADDKHHEDAVRFYKVTKKGREHLRDHANDPFTIDSEDQPPQ